MSVQVTLQDALRFEQPSTRAWRVLVGVVDALAQQLEPGAFAEAVDALAAYAGRFPDDMRECPAAWSDIFFSSPPDPRLKLVRNITLYWGTFGWNVKGFAGWVDLLAAAPHISVLTSITLLSMQPGQAVVRSLTALFSAARPTRWRMLNSKPRLVADVEAALAAAGVSADRIDGYLDTVEPPELSTAAALDSAEVHLAVHDAATLAALLQRTDLDHVVSLQIRIEPDGDFSEPLPAVGAPRWAGLRYLVVEVFSATPPEVAAALTAWLGAARPICILAYERRIIAGLLAGGAYARALGTELLLHELADAAGALAADQVRVMGLVRAENCPYTAEDSTTGLLARLPASTRSALRVLDWRLPEGDFPQIEAICAALPGLVIWCPHDAAVTDQRDAFLARLAAAPSSARVRLLIPHEPYRGGMGKTAPLNAKQVKGLEKGSGVAAGAVVIYNSSSSPYRITW